MGNCVGKGSATKDKDKAPYKDGDEEDKDAKAAENPETATPGDAAAGEATAEGDAGKKAVGEDKAGMEDIPLADEDAADPAVKEDDVKVQVSAGDDAPPPRPPSPPPRDDSSPGVTVTVQSKTITQETKDVDKMDMPSLGEPLDPETIISNIRAKTQGTGITMASQSKVTTVTKTMDASGKGVVNVETKETTYDGAPTEGKEDKDGEKVRTTSQTYTIENAEIGKEGGEHVIVTSSASGGDGANKDEQAMLGALKMLKDSADGLQSSDPTVVSETVHSTVTKTQTHSVQMVESTPEGIKIVNDSGPLERKVEQTVTEHSVVKVESGAVNGVMEAPTVTVSAASREGSPKKKKVPTATLR